MSEKPQPRVRPRAIAPHLRDLGRFLHQLWLRFEEDRCPQMAAGLSYASLLALVPLLAIGLALLTAFPAFDDAQERLKTLIFEALPPEQALDAAEQLDRLLANVAGLTGPGVLALAVTSILLLSNVNNSLNAIWRVQEPRSLALQLLVYWALLTLGPLLLGASLSISGFAFFEGLGTTGVLGEGTPPFTRLLAVLLAALGFAVFFFIVPNRPVGSGAALLGGAVAAGGFELLKFGFGLFIANFPSYQIVYGAMAALPILLIWVYLVWIVVLLGAEVAAMLPEWRAAYRRGFERAGPLDRLPLALALLARLQQARAGGPLRRRALTADLPMPPAEIDLVLGRLRRYGFAAPTAGGRWLLARDLGRVTLRDLLRSLDLTLERTLHWPAPVPEVLGRVQLGVGEQLDLPLDRLLTEGQALAPGDSAPAPEGRAVATRQ